jgi:hypothetical protein
MAAIAATAEQHAACLAAAAQLQSGATPYAQRCCVNWREAWPTTAALEAACAALCAEPPDARPLRASGCAILDDICFTAIVCSDECNVEEREDACVYLRHMDRAARGAEDPRPPGIAINIHNTVPQLFTAMVVDLLAYLCGVFQVTEVPLLHQWLGALQTTTDAAEQAALIRAWHDEMTLEPPSDDGDDDGEPARPRAVSLYTVTEQRDVDTLLTAKLLPIELLRHARVHVVEYFNDARLDKAVLFKKLDKLNAAAKLFNSAPTEMFDLVHDIVSGVDTSALTSGASVGETLTAIVPGLMQRVMGQMQSDPTMMDKLLGMSQAFSQSVADSGGADLLGAVSCFVNDEALSSAGLPPTSALLEQALTHFQHGGLNVDMGMLSAAVMAGPSAIAAAAAAASAGAGAGAPPPTTE